LAAQLSVHAVERATLGCGARAFLPSSLHPKTTKIHRADRAYNTSAYQKQANKRRARSKNKHVGVSTVALRSSQSFELAVITLNGHVPR